MPKGKYDMPGPFRMGNHSSGTDNVIVRDGVKGWCLMFADLYLGHMSHTDHADRAELVDLLNRGTHFEEMLDALEHVVWKLEGETRPSLQWMQEKCQLAIDKAGPVA